METTHTIFLLLWLVRLGQGLSRDAGHDLIAGLVQPGGEVARLEVGRDGVVDDLFGRQVGNCAFQGFGDLDAHFAVIFGDDQQQTVADFLAPDLPDIADPIGIGSNVFRQCGSHHQQHDLRALVALIRSQPVFQRLGLAGIQCAGLVYDMARQRRHRQQVLCASPNARQGQGQDGTEPEPEAGPQKGQGNGLYFLLKSTTGGAAITASFCTAKLGLVA